ncbi:hypothetical protein [Saccharothrix sp. ALI-22-I]|uniref:hypothetical protein n=1 Tax=Saccharothrix sp. ALI-22-I TaxID=1933778 RepID=UPI0015C2D28D|nr:hypothetical protein [Saccharothrix sp. ALI-22-I]
MGAPVGDTRHQSVLARQPWQSAHQRGEHRTIDPVQPQAWVGAPRHGYLYRSTSSSTPTTATRSFKLLAAADVPVLHVFLDLAAEELRRRIDTQVLDDDPQVDANARAFRLRNVDRCLAARAGLPPDTLVLRSDRHTPAHLADQVLAALHG